LDRILEHSIRILCMQAKKLELRDEHGNEPVAHVEAHEKDTRGKQKSKNTLSKYLQNL